MNKIVLALLVAGYCWVSNTDFEDQQIAHGQVVVAQR